MLSCFVPLHAHAHTHTHKGESWIHSNYYETTREVKKVNAACTSGDLTYLTLLLNYNNTKQLISVMCISDTNAFNKKYNKKLISNTPKVLFGYYQSVDK